jgi:hypothetical protein
MHSPLGCRQAAWLVAGRGMLMGLVPHILQLLLVNVISRH